MKNHVLRPLYVAIALVALLLLVRAAVVPDDFGIHGQREDGKNFTYDFYRGGAVDYWKNFSVKYRGKEYCTECHDDKAEEYLSSKHHAIQCENCHGPALDHPDNPELLTINRSRALCLRCHADLGYPDNPRSSIPGIDPEQHNAGEECADCHNPHKPNLEEM
jgi:predicted CXXCH cytochrome family protein